MSTSDHALTRSDLELRIDVTSTQATSRDTEASVALADRPRRYSELIAAMFQPTSGQRSKVVAFTSATAGSGVSFVTSSLAHEMVDGAAASTLLISFDLLDALRGVPFGRIQTVLRSHQSGNLVNLTDRSILSFLKRFDAAETRSIADIVRLLKAEFEQIVIDVPSLATSEDALRCASAVDSVIIVVEAGARRTEAVRVACRRLTSAGGRVAGLVCNKRRYVIPAWLYKRL